MVQDRSVVALGSVTVVGAALVAAGWAIQGRAYVPGLLMQLGTSMMLLVPLALLGFMLDKRMRRAEEQIRATAAHLDALTAVTRQQFSEHRQQRAEMFDAAMQDPAQDMIHALLSEAVEIGAIDPAGARVQMPENSLRLRFYPEATDIVARVEEPDGAILGTVPWHAAEAAKTFAERLATTLRSMGRYSGDRIFDPTAVFQQLLKLLRLGIESRTGERPRDLGPLIEIPNEQWAVSSDGLFSLDRPYHILARQIFGSHEDWPRHMRTMPWVDPAAFDEAYFLGRQLLRSSDNSPA
jgi:hypothetical protein